MRVRLRFTKLGKVRFTSHRDLARIWERSLRRSGLPVASTEGFSPRPKLHFGLALPTGAESLAEYLDVDLLPDAGVEAEALPGRLHGLLPPGLEVEAAAAVPPGTPSLQQAVTACTWEIELPGTGTEALAERVERLLAAEQAVVTRERKGKVVHDDVRPAVRWAEVAGPTPPERPVAGAVLRAELATQPRGVRPTELLAALDPPVGEGRACRTHQWIELDGARQEPLPAATRAPHAEVRAS